MKKSLYSLILQDEVVRHVDLLAHQRGTSRSNLINQILAEHLELTTPQKHIEDIFLRIAGAAKGQGAMQAAVQTSAGMLQLKSVLNYKYNPTIRYSVEITPADERYIGTFRVVSRTQSGALKARLSVFFELWAQIEHQILGGSKGGAPRFEIHDGRFRRDLQMGQAPSGIPSQFVGDAIGAYIQVFDNALELYFAARNGVDMETYQRLLELYEDYMSHSKWIL